MLKIFSQDFLQTIMFGIRPDLRIEPVQLVRCASSNGKTQYRLVRIENRELLQAFFSLSERIALLENNVAANGTRHGRNKLNNRLVRYAHRIFQNAPPQNLGCGFLFLGESAVKPIDQNVCINESGHARRGPLFSNLFREAVSTYGPTVFDRGVQSLGRTNGSSTQDPRTPPVLSKE